MIYGGQYVKNCHNSERVFEYLEDKEHTYLLDPQIEKRERNCKI